MFWVAFSTSFSTVPTAALATDAFLLFLVHVLLEAGERFLPHTQFKQMLSDCRDCVTTTVI